MYAATYSENNLEVKNKNFIKNNIDNNPLMHINK